MLYSDDGLAGKDMLCTMQDLEAAQTASEQEASETDEDYRSEVGSHCPFSLMLSEWHVVADG